MPNGRSDCSAFLRIECEFGFIVISIYFIFISKRVHIVFTWQNYYIYIVRDTKDTAFKED